VSLEALLAESKRRTERARAAWRVPERFVDFLSWCGVTPHPFQRVFCLVAYDGVQPCELPADDRAMADSLFNGVERFDEGQRAKVWSLMGGRAGKTYMLGALRLVWGAYKRDLSSLAPGQKAVALCCAPNDGLRQEIINYQLGCIRAKPELRATLVSPRTAFDDDASPEQFVIRRPWDGQLVTFAGATANRGGYGGRGRSLTDFLGDEAAFFLGENNVVNDKEIFKGAAPRVLPGGQCIGQTTAFAKLGHHWEQFAANWGHARSGISAKATTEQLRPDASAMVARERITDPENARREFDAEPMAEGASIFFSDELIASCMREVEWFGTTAHAPNPAVEKCAGGDMGFRSNSSALAISYRVMGQYVLGFLRECRPVESAPLRPSETINAFAADMRAHGVTYVLADGHYRESVVEHLGEGLVLDDAPAPADVAVRAKALMRDGRVTIPNPDTLPPEDAAVVRRMVRQLREVRGQPTAGGRITVHYPRWPDGSHGDLAVAFVNSLFRLAGEAAEPPKPKEGTAEWEEAELLRYQAELQEKLDAGRFV
jgi:hypothetical protein